jgi:hypothetical protein
MSSLRIRPRFKHILKTQKEELVDKICASLEKEKQFSFHRLPDHIYIKIHSAHQHFWSPQLHLTFEQEEEQAIVRGLYGPNPSLWAIFFFGYIILSLLATFIGIWGFSLWSLGKDTTILWGIPILGILALVLYFAGQVGLKIAAQQMFDIHHFYEGITKDKVVVH